MNKDINIRRPVQSDVYYLAANLRFKDRQEVECQGCTTQEAFQIGFEHKNADTFVATYKGVPMVMFGTYQEVLLADYVNVWLLGTNDVSKCKKEFFYLSKKILKDFLTKHKKMICFVDERYTETLNWLKRIGFIFDKPVPMGQNGELFIKATIRRT